MQSHPEAEIVSRALIKLILFITSMKLLEHISIIFQFCLSSLIF